MQLILPFLNLLIILVLILPAVGPGLILLGGGILLILLGGLMALNAHLVNLLFPLWKTVQILLPLLYLLITLVLPTHLLPPKHLVQVLLPLL